MRTYDQIKVSYPTLYGIEKRIFRRLSQSSSINSSFSIGDKNSVVLGIEAGPTRLELATSCVTGKRSNQTELRPHFLKLKEQKAINQIECRAFYGTKSRRFLAGLLAPRALSFGGSYDPNKFLSNLKPFKNPTEKKPQKSNICVSRSVRNSKSILTLTNIHQTHFFCKK